jgi:hypothetical protein
MALLEGAEKVLWSRADGCFAAFSVRGMLAAPGDSKLRRIAIRISATDP